MYDSDERFGACFAMWIILLMTGSLIVGGCRFVYLLFTDWREAFVGCLGVFCLGAAVVGFFAGPPIVAWLCWNGWIFVRERMKKAKDN